MPRRFLRLTPTDPVQQPGRAGLQAQAELIPGMPRRPWLSSKLSRLRPWLISGADWPLPHDPKPRSPAGRQRRPPPREHGTLFRLTSRPPCPRAEAAAMLAVSARGPQRVRCRGLQFASGQVKFHVEIRIRQTPALRSSEPGLKPGRSRSLQDLSNTSSSSTS